MQIIFRTLLVCLLLIVPRGMSAKDSLPNIVFFFADDLGYGDLACYGHPYAETPFLDQLAEEGTRYTQAYVTGVTCNPSRTGLMTGLHPARFQKYAADFGFGDRVTITELLKRRGYTTGHFGKWHIGPDETEVDGIYGIDRVEVIGKSKDKSAGRDDDLTSAAIEFIRKNAGKAPLYVNIWGHSTHFPVTVPDELAERFNGVEFRREDFSPSIQQKFDDCEKLGGNLQDAMQQYLGDVWAIDRNVGRVLAAIDDLGIRENTIFVFSSDHGPAPVKLGSKGAREFSENMLGYAGIYRGGKHNQWEGGVRVPLIIRWPGNVQADRVDSESVFSFLDWMPTLAAIAGIEDLPERLDGEDLSGVWLGESRKRSGPLFWQVSSSNASASMRDGNWKLHEEGRRTPLELFDLTRDPSEQENVAKQYPQVVEELSKKLNAWKAELPKSYEKVEKEKKGDRARKGSAKSDQSE